MSTRSYLVAAVMLCAAACGKKDEPAPEEKPSPPPVAVAPADAAPAVSPAERYLAYVAAFNERDEARLGQAFAEDAELRLADVPGAVEGRDAIVKSNVDFWKAMPDTRLEPQVVIARDRKVAALVLGHGTHTGPMATPAGELPPTGAETGSFGIEVVELDETGAIARATQYMDVGLLFAHLQKDAGARPPLRKGAGAPEVAVAEGEPHPMTARLTEILTSVDKGDKAAAAAAFAEDAVLWSSLAPADAAGVDAIAAHYRARARAFPSLQAEVTSVWGAGDFLVAEVTYTGRNDGPWPPRVKKATGKPVTLHAAEMFQVAPDAGGIRRAWFVANTLALMEQLGLAPAR